MNSTARLLAQIALYGALGAVIAVFSRWPVYRHLEPDQAVVRLSFSHHGQRLSDCVPLSPAELAKLPPNMRAPTRCPRERSGVLVELMIDGALVHREIGQPAGLSRDGASSIYRRLTVSAGRHRIAVRINDDLRQSAFAYQVERELTLTPAEILVIDFDASQQRITLL